MWLDVEQNTDEWLEARCGKLTGSAIGKVMANNGKAFGEPAKKLAVNLAVETITGRPVSEGYTNAHMERGHEQEPIAIMAYEAEQFVDVEHGGFFDNGATGCSPDGRVCKGIVEVKSVVPSVQYKTIKRNAVDPAYKWQVAFNLQQSGAEWIDYISFCQWFPEGNKIFIHRTYASECEEVFKTMSERIEEFLALVATIKMEIAA